MSSWNSGARATVLVFLCGIYDESLFARTSLFRIENTSALILRYKQEDGVPRQGLKVNVYEHRQG